MTSPSLLSRLSITRSSLNAQNGQFKRSPLCLDAWNGQMTHRRTLGSASAGPCRNISTKEVYQPGKAVRGTFRTWVRGTPGWPPPGGRRCGVAGGRRDSDADAQLTDGGHLPSPSTRKAAWLLQTGRRWHRIMEINRQSGTLGELLMIIRRFSGWKARNGGPPLCEGWSGSWNRFPEGAPGGDGSDHPWFDDAGGGSPQVDDGPATADVRLWVRLGASCGV